MKRNKNTKNYNLFNYSKAIATISDIDGRVVQNVILDTKNHSIELDLNNYANGIYLFKVISDNEQLYIEKFSVIKWKK